MDRFLATCDGAFALLSSGCDAVLIVPEEARTVRNGGPLDRVALSDWAIARKLAVALDGWCVPLAVTDVETWRRVAQPASSSADLLV